MRERERVELEEMIGRGELEIVVMRGEEDVEKYEIMGGKYGGEMGENEDKGKSLSRCNKGTRRSSSKGNDDRGRR